MQLIVWSVNCGSSALACKGALNESEKPLSDIPYLLIVNENQDRSLINATGSRTVSGREVLKLPFVTIAGIRENRQICVGSGPSGNNV